MKMEIFIRCKKCGKVLQCETKKSGESGRCIRCNESFTIPDGVFADSRKHKREVVVESDLVPTTPGHLTESDDIPSFRVRYTEVPPVEFISKRSSEIPLLDLSKGGMGLLFRKDEKTDRLLKGEDFVVEIDFPILVQPILVRVEVRWIHPINNDSLLQVGVQFHNPDRALKSVLKNLMKYISSRSNTLGFEKWGAFG